MRRQAYPQAPEEDALRRAHVEYVRKDWEVVHSTYTVKATIDLPEGEPETPENVLRLIADGEVEVEEDTLAPTNTETIETTEVGKPIGAVTVHSVETVETREVK